MSRFIDRIKTARRRCYLDSNFYTDEAECLVKTESIRLNFTFAIKRKKQNIDTVYLYVCLLFLCVCMNNIKTSYRIATTSVVLFVLV